MKFSKRSIENIILTAITGVLILCFSATPAFAAAAPKVSVDGATMEFEDASPYIDENSRIMVPLYFIAGPLGLNVTWDSQSRTARFSKTYDNEKFLFYVEDGDDDPDYYISGQTVSFIIGSTKAEVQYELCPLGKTEPAYVYTTEMNMDTSAIIMDSRTYAPVRYLAESFMCKVNWDGAAQSADIITVIPIALKQKTGIAVTAMNDLPVNYSDPLYAITAAGYNVPGDLAAYAREVIDLVNAQRAARGIPLLRMDVRMMKAAQARAVEATTLFSHTRPGGLSCFSIFADYGITRKEAGESLANGYLTPDALVAAWMNSEGHRANILNPDFDITGVGCTRNGDGIYYWAELFITE